MNVHTLRQTHASIKPSGPANSSVCPPGQRGTPCRQHAGLPAAAVPDLLQMDAQQEAAAEGGQRKDLHEN